MRSHGWALLQYDWCLYKKSELGHRYAQRENPVMTDGEDATCKPMRQISEENNPADALVVDF